MNERYAGHQGWRNYETFLINLHMENDRVTSDGWLSRANRHHADGPDHDTAVRTLADAMKSYHAVRVEHATGWRGDILRDVAARID